MGGMKRECDLVAGLLAAAVLLVTAAAMWWAW